MSLNVINYDLIVALRNENCHQLGFTFPQQKLTFGVFCWKNAEYLPKSHQSFVSFGRLSTT
jgi:hypothetical protein